MKQTYEIELSESEAFFVTKGFRYKYSAPLEFCRWTVFEYLPDLKDISDKENILVTFTKTKPKNKNYFIIGKHGNLDVDQYILTHVRGTLKRLYKEGYRYLYVEIVEWVYV